MKSEYKRDINGNYLVLYENEEPDTSSYQMRMLVGNSIPSILKCRVQGVDGQFMVCYDITSKQSLISLYEEKKMGYEDLQMILGGFVQVMEDMSEYLLNPCRLVLKPEYMYVDVEKRQIYFCYLPGWDGKLSQSFHQLTEYFVRTLDYGDTNGIVLAYELHKATLQENYNLGEIMKQYEAHEEERKRTMEEWREEQRQNRNRLMFGEKAEGVQMRIAEDYGNVFRLTEEEEQYDPEDTKGYYEVEEGMQAIREEGGTWKSWRKAAKRLKRNRWGSWNDFILEGDEDSDSM